MEKKKILVVSYFSNRNGCCPAEWLDDKIDTLARLEHKIVLISGINSDLHIYTNVKHYRVPSVSYSDFFAEIEELKTSNKMRPIYYLMLPIALTLGVVLDIILKLAAKGLGGGKWSWSISSFLASVYVLMIDKIDLVISTGGPASAHLGGGLAAFIFRKKSICELQDPLSGDGIGRNSRSAYYLNLIERFILSIFNKIVYVTNEAASKAKEKNPSYRNKIFGIYPGAKKFPIGNSVKDNGILTIVHLGTLYGKRNLDTLFEAIDNLIEKNEIDSEKIKIINLGDIYLENKDEYFKKKYFLKESLRLRSDAISFASECSGLLLVQHDDPCSEVTIPYKTYDYMNLEKRIFALTRSSELNKMLTENGHICASVSKVEEVEAAFLKYYLSYNTKPDLINIEILKQVQELLS